MLQAVSKTKFKQTLMFALLLKEEGDSYLIQSEGDQRTQLETAGNEGSKLSRELIRAARGSLALAPTISAHGQVAPGQITSDTSNNFQATSASGCLIWRC